MSSNNLQFEWNYYDSEKYTPNVNEFVLTDTKFKILCFSRGWSYYNYYPDFSISNRVRVSISGKDNCGFVGDFDIDAVNSLQELGDKVLCTVDKTAGFYTSGITRSANVNTLTPGRSYSINFEFSTAGTVQNLRDLGDVELEAVNLITNKSVLEYESASGKWKNKRIGISDMKDIILNGIAAGDYLEYDGVDWVNVPRLSLKDLDEVDANNPADNSTLVYDLPNTKWVAVPPPPIGPPPKLDELFDVSATLPRDNMLLMYDGAGDQHVTKYHVPPQTAVYQYDDAVSGLPPVGRFNLQTVGIQFNLNVNFVDSNGDNIDNSILSKWLTAKQIVIQNISKAHIQVVCDILIDGNANPLPAIVTGTNYRFRLSSIPINVSSLDTTMGLYLYPLFHTSLTVSNVGVGIGKIFRNKSGDEVFLKSIEQGAGIEIFNNTDSLTVSAITNTPTNIGTGEQLYAGQSGTNFNFKTLQGSDNLIVKNTIDTLQLETPRYAWKYTYLDTGTPGIGEFLLDQGVITINQEDMDSNITQLFFVDTRSLILRWISEADQSEIITIKINKQSGLSFNNNEWSGDVVVEATSGAILTGSVGYITIQKPNVLELNDLVDMNISAGGKGDILQYDVNTNSYVNTRRFTGLALGYSFRLATGAPNGGEVLLSSTQLAISRTSISGFATQLTLANLRAGSYLTFSVDGDLGKYASCRIVSNPVLVASLYFTANIVDFVNVGIVTGDIASVSLEFGAGTRSIGSLSFRNSAVATTITQKTNLTDNSNFFKVLGTTTLKTGVDFTMPTSNRLTYTGAYAKTFSVSATLSGIASGNDIHFYFTIVKNGTIFDNVIAASDFHTNQIRSIRIETDVSLTTNDFVEAFVANVEGNQSITISSFYLSAKQI